MRAITARLTLAAAAATLSAPLWAQDAPEGALAPELADASTALDAATSLGLVETLASGEPYTAFVPSNEALTAVQGAETDAVMADEAAFATLIQGYVIPGNVLAADAMTLVSDGGGTASVDSLAGTPIELTMDGESLLVNGQPVTSPDIALGNVTIHVLGGAFLPEAAAQ